MARYKGYSNSDKGQGVKKHTSEGKINKEWSKIHWGEPAPKGAQDCGSIAPQSLSEVTGEEYDED